MNHEEFVKLIVSQTDSRGRIVSRERNDLEFKESYHLKSWAKYAKTLASFVNNRGGYILFGIKDNPREITGVSNDFENLNQEKFTDYLNSLFAPEICWETGVIEINEVSVGYLFAAEAIYKPVMAQKSEDGQQIKSGDIYYRYRARTERIRYPEMSRIIDERIAQERELLHKHFEAILKGGTTSIGIVNYENGIFSTPMGVDVSIDKRLIAQVLKKAKYIKEGSFNETTGQPVLKVTGSIDLAEEIPVPDIEPDIQYPYIQKQMAEKLGVSAQSLYALIWKYNMKGTKKFHVEVTTSKSGKVHKFSDIAIQYLSDILNDNKNNSQFVQEICDEYHLRDK